MNTVVRILQAIGRFLIHTVILLLAAIGRAVIRRTRRFANWPPSRTRAREARPPRGDLSLLTACCLFSFGAVAVLPDATPIVEVGISAQIRFFFTRVRSCTINLDRID